MEGRSEARQSRERAQGALEALKEDPTLEVIARATADFRREKAQKEAERMLEEYSGVGAFFCVNDQMALGTADAVEKAERKKEILIVGVDLIPEAREAIRLGRMDASVAFSTAAVARAVLEALEEVLQGKPIFPGYRVDSQVVDAALVDAWLEKEV